MESSFFLESSIIMTDHDKKHFMRLVALWQEAEGEDASPSSSSAPLRALLPSPAAE